MSIKKKFSFLLSFILVFSVFLPSTSFAFENTTSSSSIYIDSAELNRNFTGWDYPMKPGSDEWKSYNNKALMLEVLQIPEDILSIISTEELVDIVLNYPFFIDAFLYDDYMDGINCVINDFNGAKELLNRDNSSKYLVEKFMAKDDISFLDEESDIFFPKKIALLLSIQEISKDVSIEELKKILNVWGNENSGASLFEIVYTPNGSYVDVIRFSPDFSTAEKSRIDNNIRQSYPEATFVSSSTVNYNCHAYAWFYKNTSGIYWMNDPRRFMTDGSYKLIQWPSSNDIVYWNNGEHSAIVYNGSNDPDLMSVTSKWGQGPLMRHSTTYYSDR